MEEDSSSEHETTFGTRQNPKVLEDHVLDLSMILSRKLDTITGVRDQCKRRLESLGKRMTAKEKDCHVMILREFDEYVKDAASYLTQCKDLKERTRSTVVLVRFQMCIITFASADQV